jgi:sec-independent protein translocase protein TatC
MFMLGMGLSFEIPVIILTLVRIGIIPHEWMEKGRTYFFIGNLVVCAFITPDAVSTIFMVVPVQVLLEICIQISKHWERQKRKEEANRRDE